MARILFLVVALVAASDLMVQPGQALKCSDLEVQQTGTDCNPYTRGDEAEPSSKCCNAYKSLRLRAKTREERRQFCFCVHEATSQNRFLRGSATNPATRIPRIDSLPEKCGFPFLFSADPKFDCNKIN
ncbi:hypothetical protein DCAR_0623984 [Daucus carota subsp. sativus]|uniref:Bifunctional inhibitor/plant lipid transfer protein/seed storage helical domain-containing protein n=1 Tax=Daucus carota subsp. sativus TaxID=79200 RepID=A0AAF0XCN2_DAUCS|nr:hypothetical protein DCAR_0623984 [Daucus carota subsp. sativus]